MVVVNAGHPEGSTKLEEMLSAGLRDTYPHVMREPITEFNTLLIASDEPPSAEKLRGGDARRRPGACGPCWRRPRRGSRRRCPGGEVFTDDKAPVEWLIDRSIVSYAAGEE